MNLKYVLSILLITAVLQSAVLGQGTGQSQFGTWDAVKAMPLGDKVEIKLKTGRTVKGALESASDSVITLRRDNNAATIKRDEVQRVLRVTERSSRKPVLVGAAVGAGIGAVGTGIAAAGSSGSGDDQVIFVVLSSLALAGVGALVGTLFMKKKRSVLVYETQ